MTLRDICPHCKGDLALANRWVFIGFIGEGGCGQGIIQQFLATITSFVKLTLLVYKALDLQKFNSECVVKVLGQSDVERHKAQFVKEAWALQMLSTLHVPLQVPKLYCFLDKSDPISLVEEYIPGFALGRCELMGIFS